MQQVPNLMTLLSVASLFPCPHLLPLNNALSKYGGRVVPCSPFWFLVHRLVSACTIRFPFICNGVLYIRFVVLGACRDGMGWFEITTNEDPLDKRGFISLSGS